MGKLEGKVALITGGVAGSASLRPTSSLPKERSSS